MKNLQGDVVQIRSVYGTVVVEYTYDAWGNVLSITGLYADTLGQNNPIRYRGYYQDFETGFYYLQSRYYDPAIRRFINADNAISGIGENALGYNMFVYCMNNPVNLSDSTGNWPSWATKLVAAVAVVAVVAVAAAITVATAGAGTAAAVIAVGAAKGAAVGMVSGAAVGAAGGAISHRVSTGSWEGAGEAALNGMGDGALSGAITGAVIVSTPQQVALADARKGINMYMNDKVNVPILGLVENMSWFTPAELPENKYYIFGKEGTKKLAEELNVPLLGQIPIVQSICENGDKGTPVALDENSVTGQAFLELARNVVAQTEKRNAELAPTQIVKTHK